jgi:xanthine dehydrogenase accessory factor
VNHETARVLIKGAGDLGTGVAIRLHRCGFPVIMTEIPEPTVIRRTVAFGEAVYTGRMVVEGVEAHRVDDLGAVPESLARGIVPVLVDAAGDLVTRLRPDVLVDATVSKRPMGTRITDAPIVIALGPGFRVGMHAHAVVETNRGHNLGRVILEGEAEPDTGVPGVIAGAGAERVLRAPRAGRFQAVRAIGDRVGSGEVVATVDGEPVVAAVGGILRGLLRNCLAVDAGFKVGDVDPRAIPEHCHTVSDKAMAIAGGVLEAIFLVARRAAAPSPAGPR